MGTVRERSRGLYKGENERRLNMEHYSAYCDSCGRHQPVAVIKNKRSRCVRAYCMKCYNWIRSNDPSDKEELRKRGTR